MAGSLQAHSSLHLGTHTKGGQKKKKEMLSVCTDDDDDDDDGKSR